MSVQQCVYFMCACGGVFVRTRFVFKPNVTCAIHGQLALLMATVVLNKMSAVLFFNQNIFITNTGKVSSLIW